MRKLASVEVIDNLEPIPNADRILKATVKGWECVVSKADNFSVGDKVIYVEVDSVLPPKPEFSFMKDRKYRVKTIKLKKQVSQGLILPISYLKGSFKVGDDVTKILGITKYDPQREAENALMKRTKSNTPISRVVNYLLRFKWFRELYSKFVVKNCSFPTHIVSKTNEERVQNLSIPYKDWQSRRVPFYVTEKLDGCSATFFLNDDKFGVCSRNIWLRKEDNSCYWEVARRFQLEESLRVLSRAFNCKRVVIQGEIIGNSIQGNKYKISGYDFYVFNVILDDDVKLNTVKIKELCSQFNLKTVPVIYKAYTLPKTIQELVELSKGKSKINTATEREGFVIRCYAEDISFKVINPNFLLKNDE